VNASRPESEVVAWISLRRVHSGRVANVAGRWPDGGRAVPGYLTDTLDQLTSAGLVTLVNDGPHGPLRRATLTATGQARYTERAKLWESRRG